MQKSPGNLPEVLENVGERGFPWALDRVFDTFNMLVEIDPDQSWKQILHDASEIIVDFLGAQAATIRLHEPFLDRMIYFGSYRYSEEPIETAERYEDAIGLRVVTGQKSFAVCDIGSDPQYLSSGSEAISFKALIAVPLTIERFLEDQQDIRGSLQIYFREKPKEFDDVEVRVAEMMAQRVSYVLARKRILDMKRVNKKKEWIVEKLFSKVSVDKGVKMKDLFRMMADELADIIRIQSCSLFTVSDDGHSAVLETGYPEAGGYHTVGKVFHLDEHPYLRAAITQSLPMGDFENERVNPGYILIMNPQGSKLVTPELKDFAHNHGINSILYVPLRIGKKVRHLLVFDAVDKRRFFSDEDIEILTFFGKELTQALEIERLDDILHDFKNPAIAIAGFARRVRKMIASEEKNTADMLKYMDVVIHEGMRLQEMAMSLYPVSRPERIDLAKMARDRFRVNREAINEQNLSHISLFRGDMPEGIFVKAPRVALERVFDNLLNNATKAIPDTGGSLTVRVEADERNGWIEITNTGCIDPDSVAKLSTADTKGRGLNIIYRFVRTMGGRVDVIVDESSTTFKVNLPRDNG